MMYGMNLDTIAAPGHDAPVLLHDLRRAVRAYCDRAGVYEKDVAARAGLTKSAMSKALAAGRPDDEAPAKHEPRLSTAERIAAAVGLRVGLLSGDADPLAAALSDAVAALRRAEDAAGVPGRRVAAGNVKAALDAVSRLAAAPAAPGGCAAAIGLDAPIGDLGLSARALAGLAALEIETVHGLTLHDAATLLRVRGFGPGCLQEVVAALAAHDMRLAGGAS